ncbi:Os06g0222175 [Oryza sativa Japonica Group]|uniref:Os06g0222175 protein n=1 Tax=Oryza sativa subsp. japonica TaxID=39947 RepID=A0A0P0WU43_ORYSJ|nr:Os06g0222175 [Oryza sativa Japonica Group]
MVSHPHRPPSVVPDRVVVTTINIRRGHRPSRLLPLYPGVSVELPLRWHGGGTAHGNERRHRHYHLLDLPHHGVEEVEEAVVDGASAAGGVGEASSDEVGREEGGWGSGASAGEATNRVSRDKVRRWYHESWRPTKLISTGRQAQRHLRPSPRTALAPSIATIVADVFVVVAFLASVARFEEMGSLSLVRVGPADGEPKRDRGRGG